MNSSEFRCGNVWNRDLIRGLFNLLDDRRRVGALAGGPMDAKLAPRRGDLPIGAGVVATLSIGQRSMARLCGVVDGTAPAKLQVLVSQVRAP
jgi:hypothetical protein